MKSLSKIQNVNFGFDVIINVCYFKSSHKFHFFILKGEKGLYLLKKAKEPLFNNRIKREINNLKLLPDGVGPELLYENERKGYFVENYLKGMFICKDKTQISGASILLDNSHIFRVAKKLKKLHIDTVGKHIDDGPEGEWIKKNFMIFLSHNQGFSGVTNNKILKIYGYLLRKYRLLIQGRNISMVHRDVNLENIIIKDNGEIFLIDWEASGYDYAEIDLVSFIYYAKLNERQINYFLKHYGFDFKKSSIDFLGFCYVYYVYCSIGYVLENNMVTKKYLYMERDIHILVQIIEGKLKLI